MKNKSDLKRKVLCSLLAASTMGIFYSTDAFAASVNGNTNFTPDENGNIVITKDELEDSGSKKFVIAQGNKLVIATEGNVKTLIGDIVGANGDLTAIREALANNSVVGVIGGEGQLDKKVRDFVTIANLLLSNQLTEEQKILINKIGNIDTVKSNEVERHGDTNLTIGGESISPVVIGLAGGDLSVNTGFLYVVGEGTPTDTTTPISIDRTGNVNTTIESGNVLGGVGASAAISLGNIKANVNFAGMDINAELKGRQSTTTINGDVNTVVNNGANIGAFANGGGAIAVGGQAVSTVDGNTNLTINSDVTFTESTIDGLTAGVTGGGLAVSTIGGTAASEVTGTTNISVNDGVVIGAAGGGVAAAVDPTIIVEKIKGDGNDVGNNDGSSDTNLSFDISSGNEESKTINVEIDVAHAIEGGTATAKTGDTNISLNGTTTGIGIIGGGIAAASHTYAVRPVGEGGELPEDYKDYQEGLALGSSNATADSGKATIVVNLDTNNADGVANELGTAVGGIISSLVTSTNEEGEGDQPGLIEKLQGINLDGLQNKGVAIGVIGGGVAVGHGGWGADIKEGSKDGAYAVATTDGADIHLQNGYAAGVFGGGAAVTVNNASATADSGTANIYVYDTMDKAVGVFGGGVALSAESNDGTAKAENVNNTLANSNVDESNINVYGGTVDGIYGGGMAVGNSLFNYQDGNTANDAVASVGTSNINVTGGTVNNLELVALMDAAKNDNKDGYVQWSRLGINASMAMADLKGITDNTSIAAGGMGMGMNGYADVETANITISGNATVTKDILGGGIAIDNMKDGSGAHVGTSNITINGATVKGSIYAGGAINGSTPIAAHNPDPNADGKTVGWTTDNTSSTVDTAKVVLNGATVEGEISGQGYELTTDYQNANGFDPFTTSGSYGATYEKTAYNKSVTENSTLVLEGSNTLKALDTSVANKYVGTSKIHSFNNIEVTADSVTKLEGLNDTTAIINGKLDSGNTVITVADGAKLDVSELDEKGTDETSYKVVSSADASSSFWQDSNLLYDRTAGYATSDGSDAGNYNITYKDLATLIDKEKTEAVNDFVDSLGEGGENLTGVAESVINGRLGNNPGAKEFFSDYTTGNGTSRDLGAMAMIGEAAGVTAGTISVAGDMADNSVLRLSFTQDDITGEPTVNEDGAVWAKYIHGSYDLDGMASSFGSIDSSSDFDGVTVGVDFAKKGKVQSGVAFSYGDGDSHGMGVNNDYDMWGVTLYGNVKNDDSNVIADIGFSESDNELSGMAMGKKIKADRDVSVFTAGVRAEKLYTNGNTQIVPYTGLRYYSVDPDSYTAYYNGQKFGEYDAERQNIWTLPVGVSLRNETVTDSGWRITPKADLAYIWAFGDTDNSVDLDVAGGVSTLDYTVMDSGSWLGALGIEAGKDDWCFGVGYSYQKGSHAEADKWYVNVEYSF